MVTQYNWRPCLDCKVLFSTGANGDFHSICPANNGGGHRITGNNYILTESNGIWDVFGLSQGDWFECGYCRVLFFGGHPVPSTSRFFEHGRCIAFHPGHTGHSPADPAGHATEVFHTNFRLLRLGDGDHLLSNWRNCWKCQALYYSGNTEQGKCSAGGEHYGQIFDPAVLNFSLRYL
ncbi:hypothetical protein ACFWA6_09200 [Streptomyces sp. NPDC060020]|uniref:hypothetical protein n=1 Tax=Streptomyces sp. NPDC060020 TaxID=3347038 RepID=UPI003682ACB4